jgi:hypothetical protein
MGRLNELLEEINLIEMKCRHPAGTKKGKGNMDHGHDDP